MPHSEILGSQPARGSPRLFAACHVLHRLLAPRHPPDALAFLGPHQRQPHHAPHQVCDLAGTPPVGAQRRRRGRGCSGRRREGPFQRQLQLQVLPTARRAKRGSGKHTHAKHAPCRRRKKRAGTHDLPAPAAPRRMARIAPAMPARRAPRHHLTMSKEHAPSPRPNRAGGAQTGRFASGGRARPGPRRPHLPATGKRGLVGLGRLERPTSRLSGVRSNQLSYRPERHPAGPGSPGGEGRANPYLVTADLRSDGCVRRDVQTAAGDFYPRRSINIAHGPHLHAGCVHPAVGSP